MNSTVSLHGNLRTNIPTPPAFSPIRAIGLHLFPGLLIALAYMLLVRPIVELGYPKYLAIGLAATLVLVPVELGIILYFSKKECGSFSLLAALGYREKLPLKQYLIWVPILFVWAGAALTIVKGLDAVILSRFFHWIPEWYLLNGDIASFSKNILKLTFLSSFFLTGLLAPVVEELYFRGFLLPRIAWMGKAAPLVNTILFALYHFWSPWQVITRVLAITPMTYMVQRKRSIYLGIAVHCTINIVGDALGILALILRS